MTLEIPPTVYGALRALLVAADHERAIRFANDAEREVLVLKDVVLKSQGGPSTTNILISSLVASRTKEGAVEMQMNGEITQMDLTKAREVVGMLHDAIEAAVSDQLLYAFLTQKVGLDPEKASMALLDFRELRQGSRDVVHPH